MAEATIVYGIQRYEPKQNIHIVVGETDPHLMMITYHVYLTLAT